MSSLSINNQILESLQLGAKTLKANTISIGEVEGTMEDTADTLEINQEINEALSLSESTPIDDALLEEEYRNLILEDTKTPQKQRQTLSSTTMLISPAKPELELNTPENALPDTIMTMSPVSSVPEASERSLVFA